MVYEQWSERLQYRVNNYPGSGYVVKKTINWLPGMATDFRCIRFSDGINKLSYWIESYTAGVSAIVHIRLGLFPLVYLHYGNGSVASASSGSATFDVFDDFTDGNYTSKPVWTVNAGTWGVSSNKLAQTSTTSSARTIKTPYTHTNIVISAKIKAYTYSGILLNWGGSGSSGNGYLFRFDAAGHLQFENFAVVSIKNWTQPWTAGTEYTLKVKKIGQSISVYLNDTLIETFTNSLYSSGSHIGLYTHSNGSTTFDNVIAQKAAAIEPTLSLIAGMSSVSITPALQYFLKNPQMQMPSVYMQASIELNSHLAQVPNYNGDVQRGYVSRYQVNNYPGAGYVVKITLPWSAGMSSDFHDLHFSDNTSKLSHWVETYTASSSAVVWVRLGNHSIIYLSYGAYGSANESNGEKTFDFFDDFSGSTLDTSKWSVGWMSYGSYAVSNSVLSVTGGSSYQSIGAKTKFGIGYVYGGCVKVSSESTYDVEIFALDARCVDGTGGESFASFCNNSLGRRYITTNNGVYYQASRSTNLTSWTRVSIKRPDSSNVIFVDPSNTHTASTDYVPQGKCGLCCYSNSSNVTVYWDWVFVRKYTQTEPTVTLLDTKTVLPTVRSALLILSMDTANARESGMSVSPIRLGVDSRLGNEYTATSLHSLGQVKHLTTSELLPGRLVDMKVSPVKSAVSYTAVLHRETGYSIGTAKLLFTGHANRFTQASHNIEQVKSIESYILVSFRPSDFNVTDSALTEARVLHSERPALFSIQLLTSNDRLKSQPRLALVNVGQVSESVSRVLATARETDFDIGESHELSESVLAMGREAGVQVNPIFELGQYIGLHLERPGGCLVNTPSILSAYIDLILNRDTLLTVPVPSLLIDRVQELVPIYTSVSVSQLFALGEPSQALTREALLQAEASELTVSRHLELNREPAMMIEPALLVDRENQVSRESEVSVSVPVIFVGDSGLGSEAQASNMVSIVNLQIGWLLQSVRPASFDVGEVRLKVRQPGSLTPPFTVYLSKTPYTSSLDKAPYTLELSKTAYTAVIREGDFMYELTQYDTDTFEGTLYDTDPDTGLQRLMPLSGRTVQAILRGGVPQTTVTKACTVTGDGKVTFSLTSTDTAVPGLYYLKFLVEGTGFRKELPETRVDAQEILLNDAHHPEEA